MIITKIKIEKLKEADLKTSLLAYASITLDNAIKINKIKILKNKYNDLFVAFPSRKINDEYCSLVEVESNLFTMIMDKIISEYKKIDE